MTSTPRRVVYLLGHGEWGGIERHVLALARNLDPERWRPHVVFLFKGGPAADAMRSTGIPVSILGVKNGHDPSFIFRFADILRKAGPAGLIHSHELHLMQAVAMRWHPQLRRLPWIHTEHCALLHGPSPGRSRFIWNTAAGRIDLVIGVSQATCDQVVGHTALCPRKCQVVHNGIDLDDLPSGNSAPLRSELGLPPGTTLIGSVGRLAAQKDWDSFIHTASIIARELPDAHFIITGDGPERARLELLADQSGLVSRIHFLGSRADARAIIGALDLFLLTSRHEELPTTLLEAFAMRTPVAGFIPKGGVAEILAMIDPSPYVAIRDRNTRELAMACLRLIADHPSRHAMIDRAERLARESFSMKRIADEVQSVYESVPLACPLR